MTASMTPLAQILNKAMPNLARVPPVPAIQESRPIPGTGAGQGFSDDPFARMLEQSRQSARLQARREQNREPERAAPAASPASDPASASESQQVANTEASRSNTAKGSKQPPIATQPGEASPPDSDTAKPPRPEWALTAHGSSPPKGTKQPPIATPPREASPPDSDTAKPPRPEWALTAHGSSPPKGTKQPPIATPPGGVAPPVPDPEAEITNGARRLVRLPPIECPVEPWLMQAQAANQTATAALTQQANHADELAMKKKESLNQHSLDAQLQKAGRADAAADAYGLKGADAAKAVDNAEALALAAAQPAAAAAAGMTQSTQGPGTASTAMPVSMAAAQAAANMPVNTPVSTPTSAPIQAHLQAHPESSNFGMQLSHQVTLWLRQGVTEARLTLNPAELGPVQIAIGLDGQAAQVRLSAEHALTRQALEFALPSLASTLADAGFLLAGGGVFDQTPGQNQQGSQSGSFQRGADGARADDGTHTGAMPPTSQPASRPSRGQVDLVA